MKHDSIRIDGVFHTFPDMIVGQLVKNVKPLDVAENDFDAKLDVRKVFQVEHFFEYS